MPKRAPTRQVSLSSQGEGLSSTGNNSNCEEKMTFDISKLAVKDTGIVELESPDGEPLVNDKGEPMSITVYGPGSKQFQKAQGVRNRAILEYVRKGGKKMKDDEQRELDADFLASCTASFNGFTYKEYTGYDMFRAAYLDPSIGFISEQVNKAVGDWSNFTQGSQKT
jgi:hypothetical protein